MTFTQEELESLTHRIQFGGDEVVKAKDGAGSATLSMAYAGAHMTFRLLEALKGAPGIVECSFVESEVTDAQLFSTKIELGKEGVKQIHGLGELTDFEKKGLAEAVPELQKSIEKGIAFARAN